MKPEILDVYANTICTILSARRTVDATAHRAFNELLALAVRKVDEIAPVNVSVEAFTKAQELGFSRDLRTYCWFCRGKDGLAKQLKENFHWEHFVPVADMVRAIQALKNPSTVSVRKVLAESKIVWVLKRENKDLPLHGRADPAATYDGCGVKMKYAWADCARRACPQHGPPPKRRPVRVLPVA